jgi:hypothetical protein
MSASLRVSLPAHETIAVESNRRLRIDVQLDGSNVGQLPTCLSDLKPGTHWLSLTEVSLGRRHILLHHRVVVLTANHATSLIPPTDASAEWTLVADDETAPLPPSCRGLSGADVSLTRMNRAPRLQRRCGTFARSKPLKSESPYRLTFTVKPAGDVVSVVGETQQPSDERLIDCVVNEARRWQFPRADGYSDICVPVSFEER